MDQSPADNRRFRRIYDDHVEAIRRYCYRRVPASDVDDATVEVFTVVWRRLDTAPNGDEVLPWMYGIARNIVRNHQRSYRRQTRLAGRLGSMPRVDDPSAEIQVVRRLEDERLLDAVADLKQADREILMLAAWEGLKPAQIAAVLGIDPHAASMRLCRARNRLAKRVGMEERTEAIAAAPHTEGGEA